MPPANPTRVKKMIASLASFGYAKVKVAKRPTISILATGSELVAINETPKQDEIRDSNSLTLKSFAEKYAEIENVKLIKDDLDPSLHIHSYSVALVDWFVTVMDWPVHIFNGDTSKLATGATNTVTVTV